MNCLKCGKEIPANSIFCLHCGAEQTEKKSTARKQNPKRRGNGQGSVYKRGAVWCVRITVGHRTVDGVKKPIRKTKDGFATKKEAIEYIPTLRGAGTSKVSTLDDLWTVWRDGKMGKLSASKQTAYKIARNKIEGIVYTPIDQLTIGDLQACIDEQTPTHYPARDVKSLLSHLYKMAMAQQDVTSNLSTFLTLPENNEKSGEAYSTDEIKKFWKAYSAGDKFVGYILLMIYTGMMPGELLAAQKDMIDWEQQLLIGGGMKTKKRKTTPIVIADAIVPVLIDICTASDGPKLIHINRDSFYAEYKDAVSRAGCRPLPPYSCRHTTATALALQDIAPSVIQEVMRHSKLATTQRYIHIDVAPMLSALNKVARISKESCVQ